MIPAKRGEKGGGGEEKKGRRKGMIIIRWGKCIGLGAITSMREKMYFVYEFSRMMVMYGEKSEAPYEASEAVKEGDNKPGKENGSDIKLLNCY